MQKIWLITGCSSGLGKGIAQAVLKRGDLAAITSRNPDSIHPLIQQYPTQVFPVALDLSNPDSIKQAFEAVMQRFGKIDILVNNAGHGYRATIEESEPEEVRELFQTTFWGPMELIKQILPKMRERKNGVIVNVTSIGAVRGALGNGYYSAAKGALELASEALAKEVQHLGIHVMLVEPGAFRTGFYGQRLGASRQNLSDYDILADQYRKENIGDLKNQKGNPDKGGELIVSTILGDNPPLRLLLGSDAVQSAKDTLEARINEIHDWENVSRQSDFTEL